MKKSSVRTAFLLFSLLLLYSCGKRATTVSPHFIGIWNGQSSGSSYHMSIDENGNAYWEKQNGSKIITAQGEARIRNNELHIGLRSLHIDQYPAPDTTAGQTWSMILDQVIYRK